MNWISKPKPSPEKIDALVESVNVHPLTAYLMALRGIDTPEKAVVFLEPTFRHLPNPSLLMGMKKACERIFQAIQKKEHIVIYGDYDVDGTTSTALLLRFLREIGHPTSHLHFFIPDRMLHGYGLSRFCLPEVKGKGCDLLITVDCGITSTEEVQIANQLGMEVVIIDHHLVPENPPQAYAVINPKQEGCEFPDKDLCAVGLVFYLILGLRAHLREKDYFQERRTQEPFLKPYLSIVALGTVADIVPLLGVNRIFVSEGLKEFSKTNYPGLRALMEISKVDPAHIKSESLGFYIGPRINAAGRMGRADRAVELLITSDTSKAQFLSEEIHHENTRRRTLQNEMFQEACALLEQSEEMMSLPAIVLGHESWHLGVVGIVCAKIAEKYNKPTVLIAYKNGVGKASCRTVGDFHLYNGLQQCSQWLVQFGGHAGAAGLTLLPENVASFRQSFADVVGKWVHQVDFVPTFEYDMELPPEELTEDLLAQMEELQPFGEKNPAPVFVANNLSVVRQKLVGSDFQHLKFTVSLQNSNWMDGISFFSHEDYPLPEKTSLAYQPEINEWQGNRSIQMKVLQFAKLPSLE